MTDVDGSGGTSLGYGAGNARSKAGWLRVVLLVSVAVAPFPATAAGQATIAPSEAPPASPVSAASDSEKPASAGTVGSAPTTQSAPVVSRIPPALADPTPPDPTSLLQVRAEVRPLWSGYGRFGALWFQGGAVYQARNGLLIGGDLMGFFGIKFGSLYGVPIPVDLNLAIRPRIGFGGENVSMSVGLQLALNFQPQLGGFLRLGRLERTSVEFWGFWIIGTMFPGDMGLRLSIPVRGRVRLFATVGLDSLLARVESYGPSSNRPTLYKPRLYALLGVQLPVGTGVNTRGLLNLGLGVTHVFTTKEYTSSSQPLDVPGPLLNVGYEMFR